MSLLDVVPYESLYAFQYSPRPFTKAAKFENQLSEEVKNERLTRLLAKHREIAFKMAEKYFGQTLNVLVEEYHADSGKCAGRSTQNKMTHFQGSADLVGKTVPVKIVEAFPLSLRGERVQ
jgi:tRNA-2-methylthio-N6-dimethylallyladenosine synthase